jgi:hypothetical protein
MLIGYRGDTDALAEDAKGILSLLWNTYPGHPWHVECKRGIIFIKYLEFDSPWGMSTKVSNFDHDAAVLKKRIVMAAGEWLERAGIKRGRYEEQEITRVEGVPEKWQPKKIEDSGAKFLTNEVREEPRPQVVNGH